MKNQTYTFKNCFDSHLHFLATGQIQNELDLRKLQSAEDIRQLKILKEFKRGHWIVGFGWDENNWPDAHQLNRQFLDEIFPDDPVFFSRVDGHTSWINSKAIEQLQQLGFQFDVLLSGGVVEKDSHNQVTGILRDQAHIQAYLLLPGYSDLQYSLFLQSAAATVNQAGFTHVRDLSMSYRQWKLQKILSLEKKINIYCEGFITVESLQDLDRAYNEYLTCLNDPHEFLKIKGLKIFVDGSLGSQTAFLSASYLHKNNFGLLIWPRNEIEQVIEFCWQRQIEVAIHCIGDQACHETALAARAVSAKGFLGKLHLEHAQLLRHDTIQLLKPLHLTVHMQPCHWLSDRTWISEAIGDLKKYLFQWELLRKNKINIQFGSDSPIEKSSLQNNIQALILSEQSGIPKLNDSFEKYHEYPQKWGQCTTQIINNEMTVIFNGEVIVQKNIS